jgi:hypothetical protein
MPASSAVMDVRRQGRVDGLSFVFKAVLGQIHLAVGMSLKVGLTELGVFL